MGWEGELGGGGREGVEWVEEVGGGMGGGVGGGMGGGGRGWEGGDTVCVHLYKDTHLSTNDWLMGQYSYNSHLKSQLL